jgi:hypothetical protein
MKMSASASNTSECSICMDDIVFNKNCVTTECGHCFHASCLLQNVAHNGFNCPYCRNVMADEPEESVEQDEEDIDDEEEEDEEEEDEDTLRGFRFFFNNVYGIPHEEEDVEEEQEAINEAAKIPSLAYICQKLIQDGVTFEQLVKARLMGYDTYDNEYDNSHDIDEEIFDRMGIIIATYVPPVEEVALEEPVVIEEPAAILQPTTTVDYSAQSKRSHRIINV